MAVTHGLGRFSAACVGTVLLHPGQPRGKTTSHVVPEGPDQVRAEGSRLLAALLASQVTAMQGPVTPVLVGFPSCSYKNSPTPPAAQTCAAGFAQEPSWQRTLGRGGERPLGHRAE